MCSVLCHLVMLQAEKITVQHIVLDARLLALFPHNDVLYVYNMLYLKIDRKTFFFNTTTHFLPNVITVITRLLSGPTWAHVNLL